MSSKDELNVELYLAAYNGDVDGITNALGRGADPNFHNPQVNQQTPLHIAALTGQSTVIPALIEAGANPNSTDVNQQTPLHIAALTGQSTVIPALIEAGANPNSTDVRQWTPLHSAALTGQSTVIPALIEAGANPNSIDEYNQTPLHRAAYKGHHDSADTLLKSRAYVDAIDKWGNSPLHNACSIGHVNVVKLLISYGADPSIINNDGKTPADMVKANNVNRQVILEALENAKQDYSGVLHKALKEGHVKAKWSKLATSGAPATGKSSIIKLILDEPPPEEHHSTLAVTAPEIRRVGTTGFIAGGEPDNSSNPIWNKVNPHSVKQMIAKQIKHGVDSSPKTSATKSGGDSESSSSSDDDGILSGTTKDMLQLKDVPISVQQSTPKHVSPATSEIVKILPTVEKSPELYQSHWVYVVDSGGQAAFLDIAPALLRHNPVSILTLKLNEKLGDRPKFYFSFKGELIGEPVERQITNMQLLESSFRSLVSTDQPHLRNIHIRCSYDKPSLLVLGTFYDKVDECKEETLDQKNAALWSTLSKFRDVRLNYSDGKKKVIFPINTIARGEPEQEMAKFIRNVVCQSYIEAIIPARWFLFNLDLEEFQKKSGSMVVSKEQCLRIGEALMMEPIDVDSALMYYHDLTVFLYFPKVLPNVVFLHPQPLFDKLSELISISFADAVDHLRKMNIILPADAHDQLKSEGTFTRDILDCLSEGFTAEFTADDFLRLMADIFIIAPLPEKGKFFLPSVLPTLDNLEKIRGPFLRNMDSLVLTWEMKPLPQGVFPALVVNLLKRQISPSFDLYRPIELSEVSLQYRNAIQLVCLDLGGAILLVDAIYWLEIYYSGLSTRCSAIRCSVMEGINAVVKKFQYKPILSIPQERFLCSICPPPRNHLCRPDEDKETLTCCRDGRSLVPIDCIRQYPWIDCVSTKDIKLQDIAQLLKKEPNLTDLLTLLADIKYEWHNIGIALEVKQSVLESCKRSNEDNGYNLFKVINTWMTSMTSEVTWQSIIAAVESPIVNHKSTAVKMRMFLAKPEVRIKYEQMSDVSQISNHEVDLKHEDATDVVKTSEHEVHLEHECTTNIDLTSEHEVRPKHEDVTFVIQMSRQEEKPQSARMSDVDQTSAPTKKKCQIL